MGEMIGVYCIMPQASSGAMLHPFLRLYHGVGSTRPLWPVRFFRHPLHVFHLSWLRLRKKLICR